MKILSDILVKAGVVVEQNLTAANITGNANIVGGAVWTNSAFKNNGNGNMSLAFNGTTASITTDAGNVINAFGSGNVGFGTMTDAGFKVDVNGSLRASSLNITSPTYPTYPLTVTYIASAQQRITGGYGNEWIQFGEGGNSISIRANEIYYQSSNNVFSPNASIISTGLGGLNFKTSNFYQQGDTRYGFQFYADYTGAVASGLSTLGLVGFNPIIQTSVGDIDGSILSIRPTINTSGGTTNWSAIYYNPTVTGTVGLTHYFINAVTGKVKLGDLAGTGDRMVVVNSSGVLTAQSIPSLTGYVPTSRTITINGTSYDLSADRAWNVSANQNARTEYEFTTDGSTATYNAVYSLGQVDVFYNGSKLASSEFTATNGTSITLGFTPPSGQIVEVVAWETGGGVSNGRTLTINGTSYDLSANRSWTIDNASLGAQPQLNGTGFVKANGTTITYDNTTYLAASAVSGTTGYIPKFTGSGSIGNSSIQENGAVVSMASGITVLRFNDANANIQYNGNLTIGIPALYTAMSFNSSGNTTINGTLTGTSATFSGAITANDNVKIYGANQFWFGSAFRGQIVNYGAYAGTTDWSPFFTSETSLAFGVGGNATKALNIASNGNTTIGGTDAGERFNIRQGNIKLYSYQNTAGEYRYIGTEYSQGNGNNRAEIRFGIESDTFTNITFHTANGFGSLYEVLRMTPSGRIIMNNTGVSNNSGGRDFTIQGSLSTGGNDSARISLTQIWNGVAYPAVITAQPGSNVGVAASDMVFKTSYWNGSSSVTYERMRINDYGYVTIGQTSPNGTINGIYFRPGIESGFIVTNDIALQLSRLGSTGDIQSFYTGTTRVGTISVSGSSTSYNTTSDYRLKEDLKEYSGLDLIGKIKTYDFAWKSDKSRSYGVIAHELAEVIPYAVMGEKDAKHYQGVDYSKIVPVNTKAIQELWQIVQDQKEEIELLKARLN